MPWQSNTHQPESSTEVTEVAPLVAERIPEKILGTGLQLLSGLLATRTAASDGLTETPWSGPGNSIAVSVRQRYLVYSEANRYSTIFGFNGASSRPLSS
jgi:hypothetical protein